MTRALPRTHLNSSRLTRFLTENAMLNAAPVADDIGPRLGDWLHFRHAIALHGVLNPEQPFAAATPAHLRRAGTMTAEALTRYVEKVQAQLEQSIAQGAPPGSGLARIDMPPAEMDEPIEPQTAFEPYRRFYTAHQRQMETSIQTLRSQVRRQLGHRSPCLQQLAALDAAFENILSERETVLLAKVSKLQEKRFAQALNQHLKKQAEAMEAGAVANADLSVSAWLLPLRQAMRTALQAELDTRMQPVWGLLEAFNTHTTQEQ
ncbi:DUF3348 family protein [Limnohabitans sp. DCL3]|uniref:DUF3348 family protein n=1 Tax=Limnohabitans sp. DCL3 TaxID=3374103 RepID=UPI003A87107B